MLTSNVYYISGQVMCKSYLRVCNIPGIYIHLMLHYLCRLRTGIYDDIYMCHVFVHQLSTPPPLPPFSLCDHPASFCLFGCFGFSFLVVSENVSRGNRIILVGAGPLLCLMVPGSRTILVGARGRHVPRLYY